MMENVGYSVIAFYAADTGIEAALYDLYHSETPRFDHSNVIDNTDIGDAYYDTEAECCNPDEFEKCSLTSLADPPENPEDVKDCIFGSGYVGFDCNALNFCLESAGGYKTIKRAIRIKY